MATPLAPNTPLADALSSAVQPKLVEMGWSSDGEDSSPLSEYIVLMLVNGKTEDQITTELSGDLLGLGPEDESTKHFTRWLFEEMESLSRQLSGGAMTANTDAVGNVAQNGAPLQETVGGDDAMDDVNDAAVDGIPTGPKAMRGQSQRGKDRRPGGIFQQVNKAMERTNDPLRRVRPQGDSTRIQKHDPMKGPRQQFNNGRGGMHHHNNGMGRGFQQGVQSAFGMPPGPPMGPMGPNGFNPLMMSPEQQMQFFQMLEQQAKMLGMSGVPFPQSVQQFGGRGGYQNNHYSSNAQPGRSMFDRVEVPNEHGRNGRSPQPKVTVGGDADMKEDSVAGEDSMETEQESCKFGLKCTKADCYFAHPSPASDPSRPVTFSSGEKCPFGANCKNRKCTSSHPSPANAPKATSTQQDCRFWPNCTNPTCPFKHPATPADGAVMPPCRFGAQCTRPNCHFTHIAVDIPCRFQPCLNPLCVYKHVEGQQEGVFDNKVWTPTGGTKKPHVSERRFTNDDGAEEELIIPGQSQSQQGDTEMDGSKVNENGVGTEVTV